MIESLNEKMEIKLSSLSVFLQLVAVASCRELKRGAIQGCGPLTECDCQNGCWKMRVAVGISDRRREAQYVFYK